MKLEVGMYVRTKYGIAKYTGMFNSLIYELDKSLIQPDDEDDYLHEDNLIYSKHDILKASHNIIDLIEVGDYVNGTKVTEIFEDKEKQIKLTSRGLFTQKYIKSIVTKEQFESMSYLLEKESDK